MMRKTVAILSLALFAMFASTAAYGQAGGQQRTRAARVWGAKAAARTVRPQRRHRCTRETV